jgi:hypothetical protein
MKAMFAALCVGTLSLASAQLSLAQSRIGPSDDFVCHQGDPKAENTISACGRLQAYVRSDDQSAANLSPVQPAPRPQDDADAPLAPTSAQPAPPPATMASEPNTAPSSDQGIMPPPASNAPIAAAPSTSVWEGWLLLVALVCIYFYPTTMALNARNRQVAAIFALNLLLGWTLVGWVIALVWALVKPRAIAPSSHQQQ